MISNKKNFLVVALKKWNHDNFKKIKKKNFFLIKNKKDLTFLKIKKINPQYIFFPHWSYKIKTDIINNYTCIGFHESDLPYGRGGSPVQNLILRNKVKTKITAFIMNNSLDEGDVVMKKNLSLRGSAQEIFERSSNIIFKMINVITKNKKLAFKRQKGKAYYFKRLKNNALITSKDLSINGLYNKIRMLDADSYERAHLIIKKKLKIEFSDTRLRKNNLYCKVKINLINDKS